jgi:hypothetical protein
MEKLRDNWIVVVFTMIVTMAGTLALNSFTQRQSEISNAAPVDYVDKRDLVLQKQIDKKADKEDIKDMKHTLIIIDQRIYEIWKQQQK